MSEKLYHVEFRGCVDLPKEQAEELAKYLNNHFEVRDWIVTGLLPDSWFVEAEIKEKMDQEVNEHDVI